MPRYFFALWPNNETRDKLFEIAKCLPADPGRKVIKQNLHITLIFLGSIVTDVLRLMRIDAAKIRVPSFSMEINTFSWWKKSKVASLAPNETPEVLLELVTKLGALSRTHNLDIDKRPYKPHVTIVRKVSRKPQYTKFTSIQWNINDFCLLKSVTYSKGAEYKVVEAWSLLSS